MELVSQTNNNESCHEDVSSTSNTRRTYQKYNRVIRLKDNCNSNNETSDNNNTERPKIDNDLVKLEPDINSSNMPFGEENKSTSNFDNEKSDQLSKIKIREDVQVSQSDYRNSMVTSHAVN